MRLDRQRLPKVLLARVGHWRPSNAVGRGAAPTTMPEFNAAKHSHPEGGPEEELDKRLSRIKELFAIPPKVKEFKLSPRLEEMSKPRMIKVPDSLSWREYAPVEPLIKKKRRPIHIPMSPKERMASSGSAPHLGHSNSDLMAELDSRLSKFLEGSAPNSRKSSKPSSPAKAKAKAKAGTSAPADAQRTNASKTAAKLPAARTNSIDVQSTEGQSGGSSTLVEDLPESGDSNMEEFDSYSSDPGKIGVASDTFDSSSAAGPADRTLSGTYSADEFASMSAPLNESEEFYSDEDFDSSKE
mmetsp:Transcript_101427/g.185761  ORF Transcript_101427/g.185761 Transcript_101427/m.185761 type:complete len:298 (-) Transcript_101427:34-927(-)